MYRRDFAQNIRRYGAFSDSKLEPPFSVARNLHIFGLSLCGRFFRSRRHDAGRGRLAKNEVVRTPIQAQRAVGASPLDNFAASRRQRRAAAGLREISEFYEHPADVLWVTMAHGHFWWAFAEESVFVNAAAEKGEPPRYRQTRSGWSKVTLNNRPLTVSSLSSALTKTASYRMTICELDHADYLLRRIRGDQDPVQTAAAAVQGDMSRITLQMIDRLDWRDFETLIELIFTRGGWQRTSELGKNQADVDLVLVQPITREKAWVQIKSTADQRQLDDYLDRFFSDSGCERFFFVYHKARGRLSMSHERRSPQHRADI